MRNTNNIVIELKQKQRPSIQQGLVVNRLQLFKAEAPEPAISPLAASLEITQS